MDFTSTTGKAALPQLENITGEKGRGQSRYHPPFEAAAFEEFMSTRSAPERQAADNAFKDKYGKSLEEVARDNLQGPELIRALSAINRPDGDIVSPRAAEVKAILKGGESGFGAEKNLREIFATSTAADMRRIAETFAMPVESPGATKAQRHNTQPAATATDLFEAIKNSPFSDKTKAALEILKGGSDKRTTTDSLRLAELGLSNKDVDLFALGMAMPEARKLFLENAGEAKVLSAFGNKTRHLPNETPVETPDSRRALDIARTGHTSAATEVHDQTWHFPLKNFTLNPDGVDFAIARMSEEERQAYMLGKSMAEHPERKLEEKSEEQKQFARDYYQNLHPALEAVGNSTDMVKWENQIAVGKSKDKGKEGDSSVTTTGSIVGHLAGHRGLLYNGSTREIRQDIAGMTRAQWQDAKDHPERREEMSRMLKSLGKTGKSYIELMDTYDAMLKAGGKDTDEQWKNAKDASKPPLLHAIGEARRFGGTGVNGVFEALGDMSQADQNRLRTDADFKKTINKSLRYAVDYNDQAHALERMLAQVGRGEKPKPDIAAKIAFETDPALAVRAVQKEFKKDPAMQKRLAEPDTDADKKMAKDFRASMSRLFSGSFLFPSQNRDYLTDQLLKDGKLPLAEMAEFSKASLKAARMSNDVLGLVKDALDATPQERARLLSDKPADIEYQKQVFSGFTPQERALAHTVINQGKIQPEDKIRAGMVGWNASASPLKPLKELLSDKVKKSPKGEAAGKEESGEEDDDEGASSTSTTEEEQDTLGPTESFQAAKVRYAQKYGRDLENDVLTNTYDDERETVRNLLRSQLKPDEQADAARKEAVRTRSGFGAAATDVFSGTGLQADESLRQLSKQLAATRKFKPDEPPPQAQIALFQERLNNLHTAIEKNREAKNTVGETASDLLIGAVGIGSAVSTGGLTLPAVLKAASASALIKVGANSIMRHDSYKTRDALVGAAGGLGSMLGPGEIASAALLKLGAKPAGEAVSKVVGQDSFKKLFVHRADFTRASESLSRETSAVTREALANNTDITGNELKAAVTKALAPTLPSAAQAETINRVTRDLSVSLNADLNATGAARRLAISQGLSFGAVSAATFIQRVSDDGMIGKSPGEIARNLGSDFQSAIEYSIALDAIGFAGAGAAKIIAKARAPHPAIAANREEHSEKHSKGMPPGAISMLVNTLPDPPESGDGKEEDDDDDKSAHKK